MIEVTPLVCSEGLGQNGGFDPQSSQYLPLPGSPLGPWTLDDPGPSLVPECGQHCGWDGLTLE